MPWSSGSKTPVRQLNLTENETAVSWGNELLITGSIQARLTERPGSGTLTCVASAFPVPRERLLRVPWVPGQSSKEFHPNHVPLSLDESVSALIFWPLFWKQSWYKKLLCFSGYPSWNESHRDSEFIPFERHTKWPLTARTLTQATEEEW